MSQRESIKSAQELFNFNDIINLQLDEVKQNTLSFLDKTIQELEKRYSLYIKNINQYINENELKISKVIKTFETDANFINYADDKIL